MEKHASKALSEQDLNRLMRAVCAGNNRRDIAIVELLVGAGILVEELLDLKVGNLEIKPSSGQVTVRKGKRGRGTSRLWDRLSTTLCQVPETNIEVCRRVIS